MASDDRQRGDRNGGDDPFPEIPRRPPVRQVEIDTDEPLRLSFTKLVDHVSELSQRQTETSADVRNWALATSQGFMTLNGKIDTLKLPPMRPELPSTAVAAVQRASKSFSSVLRERAKQTPGPEVSGKPEEFEALADRSFAEQMAEYERTQELKKLREQEAERQRADVEKRKDRKTFWILTISGLIVAVATIVLTNMMTRATAHEQGLVDGAKLIPPVATMPTFMVTAPPPPSIAVPMATVATPPK